LKSYKIHPFCFCFIIIYEDISLQSIAQKQNETKSFPKEIKRSDAVTEEIVKVLIFTWKSAAMI